MKLCKDCKHADIAHLYSESYKCNSPKRKSKTDLITGKKVYMFSYCNTQRSSKGWFFSMTNGLCGESGRFFEPK